MVTTVGTVHSCGAALTHAVSLAQPLSAVVLVQTYGAVCVTTLEQPFGQMSSYLFLNCLHTCRHTVVVLPNNVGELTTASVVTSCS
eukprot:51041-Eustigmatos_ZCMA.PRE.1